MTSEQIHTLQVKYEGGKRPFDVGRLALINRKIFFEYSPSFFELGLELSPFKLPLKAGVLVCEDRVFEGLFGVFNDSLPDGWGRLLLDRKLRNSGINPSTMTPIDRLRYVGTHGMGALRYEPEFPATSHKDSLIDLDVLADECFQFQTNDQDQFIDDLIIMNGSSAGARPKVLVRIDEKRGQFQMTTNNLSHAHQDWIVKFRSSVDPQDSGPIEYAYHLMAKKAGLIVPEAKLFKSRTGPGYFGVRRFDRTEHTFLHTHTLSGLLHADYRIPSLDYETVMKATYILTRSMVENEKQFRNIVFNVFSYNRDDHAKNFSFIMDDKGTWTVSPAYDLTFSTGPGGEHCTAIRGNGRNPGTTDLLKLGAVTGINEQKAQLIIDQVKEAVSKWRQFAEEANVSQQSSKNIYSQLSRIE
jgi:serine/threonine-protein kinase HipA